MSRKWQHQDAHHQYSNCLVGSSYDWWQPASGTNQNLKGDTDAGLLRSLFVFHICYELSPLIIYFYHLKFFFSFFHCIILFTLQKLTLFLLSLRQFFTPFPPSLKGCFPTCPPKPASPPPASLFPEISNLHGNKHILSHWGHTRQLSVTYVLWAMNLTMYALWLLA